MSEKTTTTTTTAEPATTTTTTTVAPPAPPNTLVFSAQEYKNQKIVESKQQASAQRLDETTPGGRYLLADGKTYVDADGQPIKGKGD